MIKNALVVTRHPGLVAHLRTIGLIGDDATIIAHATPDQVADRQVIGVLPHSLSCLCTSLTEVPLNIPAELRGQELTEEQVRQYAGDPVTYKVTRIPQVDPWEELTPRTLGILAKDFGVHTPEELKEKMLSGLDAKLDALGKKTAQEIRDWCATHLYL